MKILIICSHSENVSARLLARGFKQLGHEVKTSGPVISGWWWPDFNDIEDGLNWRPDLAILADHHIRPPRRPGCPYILFAEDYSAFAPDVYAVRDEVKFDHEFTFFRADCEGRERATLLRVGYDPTVHTPGPSWAERSFDVSFMGAMGGGRQELIDFVKQYYPVVTGYTDLDGYVLNYQYTRIALCHSRSAGYEIEQRIIEQMAMGCLVLSEPRINFGDYGIEEGRHIRIYHSPEEALGIIDSALARPGWAEQMAQRGRERILPYTWASQAQIILETMKL